MKTITSFSYKGGAGRTTLTVNVLPFIIKEVEPTEESPVILVDMDIDSCGLTYLFDLADDKNIKTHSVQSFFGDSGKVPQDDFAETLSEHRAFKYLCPVGHFFGYEDKAVLCLPARPGVPLGIGNSYDGKPDKFIEFKRLCSDYGVSALVLDSAVGDQLTARWSIAEASNIICCLRPTKQFRDGTIRFFSAFENAYEGKNVIVVPNVVPSDELDIPDRDGSINHYPSHAKEAIIAGFSAFNKNNYTMDIVKGAIFGVPKIDRFMWQEGVLAVQSDPNNPFEKDALKQYQKIVNIIFEK